MDNINSRGGSTLLGIDTTALHLQSRSTPTQRVSLPPTNDMQKISLLFSNDGTRDAIFIRQCDFPRFYL